MSSVDELPLGWIAPQDRTQEQNDIHAEIMSTMPKYSSPPVAGGTPPVGTKILLTDLWKHPKVAEAYGYAYPGTHQISGSCVWAAGHNSIVTVNFVDVLRNNELEKITPLFTLHNYGISRMDAGMRGQGEGSFGSTFAKSITRDGLTHDTLEGINLPKPKNGDGLVWGKNIELYWSDGRNVPEIVRKASREHPIHTATETHDGNSVRDFILNGYAVLRAGMRFVNPNTTRVRNGVCLGSYNGRGGHQESWLGYWNHPQEGELIWEHNQWGLNIYDKDPGGGPGGGCWIRLEEVDQFCKAQYSEVFAISQFIGFPAQPDVYDWVNGGFFS